jgi:hypothetical protein
MKNIIKKFFSCLTAFVITSSIAPVAACASDYADMIKSGNNNSEVLYDGQAYTTDLDANSSALKPIISIEKKTVFMSDISAPQTVNVSLKGSKRKYDSVGLHFIYDSRLKVIKNEYDESVTYNGNLSFECMDLGNNEIFISNMGSQGKDGDALWQITFVLPENAKPGDLYPIGIEYRTMFITEDCFNNHYCTTEGKLMEAWLFTKGINNGYINVEENIADDTIIEDIINTGDVNGDGMINAVDASRVLVMYAALNAGAAEVSENDMAVCDINKDNMLNAVDASLILAYYANLNADPTLTLESFLADKLNK